MNNCYLGEQGYIYKELTTGKCVYKCEISPECHVLLKFVEDEVIIVPRLTFYGSTCYKKIGSFQWNKCNRQYDVEGLEGLEGNVLGFCFSEEEKQKLSRYNLIDRTMYTGRVSSYKDRKQLKLVDEYYQTQEGETGVDYLFVFEDEEGEDIVFTSSPDMLEDYNFRVKNRRLGSQGSIRVVNEDIYISCDFSPIYMFPIKISKDNRVYLVSRNDLPEIPRSNIITYTSVESYEDHNCVLGIYPIRLLNGEKLLTDEIKDRIEEHLHEIECLIPSIEGLYVEDKEKLDIFLCNIEIVKEDYEYLENGVKPFSNKYCCELKLENDSNRTIVITCSKPIVEKRSFKGRIY